VEGFCGEWQKVIQKAVRWPRGVCCRGVGNNSRGVGNNSIQCTSCQKLVHRKCSGIKGSMYKVMKTFICRDCVIPVTGTGCISVDIGINANLELVDKFCYLGDMLTVDRDAGAAMENRIRMGWNILRQLVPLLTNKDILLKVRGRLYSGCVRCTVVCCMEVRPGSLWACVAKMGPICSFGFNLCKFQV